MRQARVTSSKAWSCANLQCSSAQTDYQLRQGGREWSRRTQKSQNENGLKSEGETNEGKKCELEMYNLPSTKEAW